MAKRRGSQRPSSSALQFENYARRLQQLSGFDDPVLEAALERGIREQATAQVERAEQSAGLTGQAQTVLGGFARAQSAALAGEAAMSKRMQNQRMLLEMEQKALSTSAQLKEQRYKTNLQHEQFLEQMAYQRSQKKSALMGALGGALVSAVAGGGLKGLFTKDPVDPTDVDLSGLPSFEAQKAAELSMSRFGDQIEGISTPITHAPPTTGGVPYEVPSQLPMATSPTLGSIQARHAPPTTGGRDYAAPDLIPWERLDTYGIPEGWSQPLHDPLGTGGTPYLETEYREPFHGGFDYWGSGDPSPWDSQVPAEWRTQLQGGRRMRMGQPLHAPPVTSGTPYSLPAGMSHQTSQREGGGLGLEDPYWFNRNSPFVAEDVKPYWFEDRGEESMQLRNNFIQLITGGRGW